MELKEKELQSIVRSKSLDSKLKGNPNMRKAIWNSVDDLKLETVELPVTKPKEDAKRIWDQINKILPFFVLFQSDRSNSDADDEVQDPMKVAIAVAISEVQQEIEDIQKKVKTKAVEIANRTHKTLSEIDENLANELDPKFNPPTKTKWNNLFSIELHTDDGIPLNKRGSGIRRLILLSFLKAEAERMFSSNHEKQSIIYAIEEPETSQHPNNQKILIESLKSLAEESICQVMLTTHSPGLAMELPIDSLRFIDRDHSKKIIIGQGKDILLKIAKTLGILPDSMVKVLIYVEGPTDIVALKWLSKALNKKYPKLLDLSTDERVAFVLLGGSTLKHWVNEDYLKGLGKLEFHLYDRDMDEKYKDVIEQIKSRNDESCAQLTQKRESENYLHKDAIKSGLGVEVEVSDEESVPSLFSEAYSMKNENSDKINSKTAKKLLSEKAFPMMNCKMIEERDKNGEVKGWFEKINAMFNYPVQQGHPQSK